MPARRYNVRPEDIRVNKVFFDRVNARWPALTHVAEVGVGDPRVSQVAGWIRKGVRTDLVEALPNTVAMLCEDWGDLDHVSIHPYAMADAPGTVTMFGRYGGAWIEGVVPPLQAAPRDLAKNMQRKVQVEARTFDTIDDGTIEALSIDVEGSEWWVLKNVVSRPKVISLELVGPGWGNPHRSRIAEWLGGAGYSLWYENCYDFVYTRES